MDNRSVARYERGVIATLLHDGGCVLVKFMEEG